MVRDLIVKRQVIDAERSARADHGGSILLSPRAFLTAQEISDLDAALMMAYRMNDELRAKIPAARFIARPPIPAVLSESLIGYSAHWLFGDACTATFGGRQADLIVRRPLGDQLLIEVKATGAGEFQEVKPRDLAADALVWVAFGSRYVDGNGPTDIYVLPDPSRFEPPTTRSGTVKAQVRTQSLPHRGEPPKRLLGLAVRRYRIPRRRSRPSSAFTSYGRTAAVDRRRHE